MTISTVHSGLLSEEDRERVEDALEQLEKDGSLPEPVMEPVLRLLRLVAEGRSASVLASDDLLTSNQAARLLGVSRPFLNKLLDQGRIPYHRNGRDRRIAAKDIESFIRERDDLKQRHSAAISTYEERRNERLAVASGVSKEEASELGFG